MNLCLLFLSIIYLNTNKIYAFSINLPQPVRFTNPHKYFSTLEENFNKKVNNFLVAESYIEYIEDIHKLTKSKGKFGVLSTLGSQSKLVGYPIGSVVGYAINECGKPIMCLSDISLHSKNVEKNTAVSLCVMEENFTSGDQQRVIFTGNIKKIVDYELVNHYKHLYIDSHEDALWVCLKSFHMYELDDIKDIYYIGGFAKAKKINVKNYLQYFL